MKKILFVLLTITSLQASTQTRQPILLTDMLRIKTVGNLTASPQGNKVAFTVTSIEADDKREGEYRYVTQLFTLANTPGAKPVQLTYGRESSSSPAWSPDGKQLAFVRAVDGKAQVFILPMDGGEAWQLTKSSYGASSPKWSPDGKRIAYAASIGLRDYLRDSTINPTRSYAAWPTEKPGLTNAQVAAVAKTKGKGSPDGSLAEVRSYLLNNEAEGKATVLNKLNFQDEANISGNVSATRFFITDVAPMAKSRSLTGGFFRYSALEFTPDGKGLILTADIDSLESPDRSLESQIYTADADGSNLKLLLGKKGFSYNNAEPSPSGKWLAYQVSNAANDSVTRGGSMLMLMPMKGTEAQAVAIPFDRNKGGLTWSPDERWLYFTAQSNGGQVLYRVDVAGRKIEPLSGFDAGITSFALQNNGVVYAQTAVANPSELFVADAMVKGGKAVGGFNDWVKEKNLSMPEKHTFVNEKGLTVEYWVMKPAAYQAGKKYPLLLEIHGGPSAMWGPGEASMWHEYQYFCSKGYGVVYSNPRGSGGYGEDFRRANIADWGKGPTSDVLTALDKTVVEGWADTSKLLVTGGSYAGYLVAWIISHDQRFAAACSQRGVYDLATFFGEGNAWRLVPGYFGGYPWEPSVQQLLQRESPINYVQNITTPYIIFHGDNDRRTGFVQSEMLYRSLKVLNRPVEYVRHSGGTHELTRSGDNRQRIDQLLRTWEFFERYIGR